LKAGSALKQIPQIVNNWFSGCRQPRLRITAW
jgi:hypothetical protein